MARIIALTTPSGMTLWSVAHGAASPGVTGQPDLTVSDENQAQAFPARLAGTGPLDQATPTDRLPAVARLMTLGAVADSPNWDGIVLVIDAESAHWTHVSAGEAISTLGTATPEIAHRLGADGLLNQEAMDEVMTRPERLTSALYAAREHALSQLVGADLAAARRWWLGHQLRVIGDGALARAYADALMTQGAPVALTGTDVAIRRGLLALVG
jgi:2-dehydro-3-deoxygalactonokinase